MIPSSASGPRPGDHVCALLRVRARGGKNHAERRGVPVRTSTRRKLCPSIGKLFGTPSLCSIKPTQNHPIAVAYCKVGVRLRLQIWSGDSAKTRLSIPRGSAEAGALTEGRAICRALTILEPQRPGAFRDDLSSAQRITKSLAQAAASGCVGKRRKLSCNKGPLAKVTRQRPSRALLTSGNPGFIVVCLGSRSKAAR